MSLQILRYREFTHCSYEYWVKVYTLANVLEIEEREVHGAHKKGAHKKGGIR